MSIGKPRATRFDTHDIGRLIVDIARPGGAWQGRRPATRPERGTTASRSTPGTPSSSVLTNDERRAGGRQRQTPVIGEVRAIGVGIGRTAPIAGQGADAAVDERRRAVDPVA